MRRLLKGHAVESNLRHKCAGHLFPNRYVAEPTKERTIVKAKSIVCYVAMRKLLHKGTEIASSLAMSPSGVSVSATRGNLLMLKDRKLQAFLYQN